MTSEEVPFEQLPDCVKAGLAGRKDLAGSAWVKRRISLDELGPIGVSDQTEDERQAIQQYKEDYLQRREVCPPAFETIDGCLWPADGFHRIAAYCMAAEEDKTLPEWIEGWVRVR